MKQIMEQYGSAIIAGIVAIVLLGVFFGWSYRESQGMPQMLGDITNVALLENSQMSGTSDSFEKHMEIVLPEITLRDSYACVAKEWIAISDCLVAVDDNGRQWAVLATSGWSAGATNGTITVSNDGTEIYASEAGIYWLQASVSADNGRSREVVVKLLVNEEAIA